MSMASKIWVSVIAAMSLPVLAAYAAEPKPASEPSVVSPLPAPVSKPAESPVASAPEPQPGLKLDLAPASPDGQSGLFRYGSGDTANYATSRPASRAYSLGSQGIPQTRLNLAPQASEPKTGWETSGRVGPLRWLNSADGETKMRFGGRVKDQPRIPGPSLFNLGIHYKFE